jgi:hypothetical protein
VINTADVTAPPCAGSTVNRRSGNAVIYIVLHSVQVLLAVVDAFACSLLSSYMISNGGDQSQCRHAIEEEVEGAQVLLNKEQSLLLLSKSPTMPESTVHVQLSGVSLVYHNKGAICLTDNAKVATRLLCLSLIMHSIHAPVSCSPS